MISVTRGQSPINTKFKYCPEPPSAITMDLSNFEDIGSHLKMVKNTIIYAIILSLGKGKLASIHIQADKSKRELLYEKFLPLIENQARFFDLEISPCRIGNKTFVLSDGWVQQIVKNINFPLDKVKEKLKPVFKQGVDNLLFYRSVSEGQLQIRFKGYQVGRWLGREGLIAPVNNDKNITDIAEWIGWLAGKRSDPSCKEYYNDKEEHYLEATLLEKLLHNGIKIGDRTITKLFRDAEVFFQFPVLLKPGASTHDSSNSAKYIDILAKSENRPVVMELKVWGNRKGKPKNSRGDYMFSAISQVLGYCNYLVGIFGKQEQRNEPELRELYNLDWGNPIIYIIINEIGDDKVAKRFRYYMEQIKRHIINAELHFVEFKQDLWGSQRKFEVKNII